MEYQDVIVQTVEKALPAVVSIAISKNVAQLEKDIPQGEIGALAPYRELLEQQLRLAPRDEEGRIKLGGGSGFIISANGLVLTNKHVVMDPSANYTVITSGGKHYEATVLARDPVKDVAILRIDEKKLPTMPLGTTMGLRLGQTVVAIGNALGEFQNSVSTGVVSGLSRLITATTDMSGNQQRLRGLIQTDAAINPGNSGGPLVNLKGEVIGINVAVVFGAQNIGFAIPIEEAKKDLEEIKRHGHIRRPFLGIRYVLLNEQMQKRFRLPTNQGALIINEGVPGEPSIVPGSAAEKAGLKEFDIVTQSNGKPLTQENTLEDVVSEHAIGETITLTVLREGKELEQTLKLEELPQQKKV